MFAERLLAESIERAERRSFGDWQLPLVASDINGIGGGENAIRLVVRGQDEDVRKGECG
jgi:hypothetical protein